MKILHLAPTINAASGGQGLVPINLVRYQQRLGVDAEIWCFDTEAEASEIASGNNLEGSIKRFPSHLHGRLNYSPAAAHELTRLGSTFDLIHQHGIWLWHSQLAAQAARRHRKPLLLSPHGTLEKDALGRSRWKKWIALRLWESRNLRSADCLHATSEKEVGSIRAFGLKNPVMILPNGVPPELLNETGNRQRFLSKHKIASNRRILLFLSRIHPIKGLPMLISAMQGMRHQLGDWLLVIAGVDEGGHEAELRRAAAEAGLEKQVQFTGPLFGQGKFDAYAASTCFVLPSYSENFSIAVAEALAFRLPVLTTTGAPWREIAVQKCGWWVAPTVVGIKEGLAEMIGKPLPELALMGERGRNLIATKYLWDQIAEKSVKFYSAIIARDFEKMNSLNNNNPNSGHLSTSACAS